MGILFTPKLSWLKTKLKLVLPARKSIYSLDLTKQISGHFHMPNILNYLIQWKNLFWSNDQNCGVQTSQMKLKGFKLIIVKLFLVLKPQQMTVLYMGNVEGYPFVLIII